METKRDKLLPASPLVLVVEDDAVLRETLCEVLRSDGLTCCSARDGEEALDLLARIPIPSLVVLDLVLPRFDGWNLIRVLEGLAPIPVLVTSGMDAAKSQSLAHGAASFLPKPLHMDRFLAEVRRLCPRAA